MAEAKQLFDKPMGELREAFVRNRFAEDAMFGRADIEEWLANQRKAERPDEAVWQQSLARSFMIMCAGTAPITHLRERATPYATFSEERLIQRSFPKRHGVQHLLGVLHASPAVEGVYYGHTTGCVIVYILADGVTRSLLTIQGGTLEQLVVEQEQTNPAGAAHLVIDTLFAEWDRQRPKWKEARLFLCNALAEEVKRERAKAEHDFNTAVAVSADGTKIVHADWVVVRQPWNLTRGSALYDEETRRCYRVFRGEQFRGCKALRPGGRGFTRQDTCMLGILDEHRIADTITPVEAGAVAAKADSLAHQWTNLDSLRYAVLSACSLRGGTPVLRFYVTTTDLCPSPLPDGGVEVTV